MARAVREISAGSRDFNFFWSSSARRNNWEKDAAAGPSIQSQNKRDVCYALYGFYACVPVQFETNTSFASRDGNLEEMDMFLLRREEDGKLTMGEEMDCDNCNERC